MGPGDQSLGENDCLAWVEGASRQAVSPQEEPGHGGCCLGDGRLQGKGALALGLRCGCIY